LVLVKDALSREAGFISSRIDIIRQTKTPLPPPNATNLLRASPICRSRPHVKQLCAPFSQRSRGRWVRRVEDPAGVRLVAARSHQASLTQDRKMVRYKALREVQHVLDLADAQLLPGEQREDAQARLVCQCLEGNQKVSRHWRGGLNWTANNHGTPRKPSYHPSLIWYGRRVLPSSPWQPAGFGILQQSWGLSHALGFGYDKR